MTKNTIRRMFTRKRFLKIILFLCCTIFFLQIAVIGNTAFRLKSADIYVSNLTVDISNGFGVNVSVDSNILSPLTMSLSNIVLSVGYLPESNTDTSIDLPPLNEVIAITCKEASLKLFKKVQFNAFFSLKNLDLSAMNEFEISKLKNCDVSCILRGKIFFFIPFKFTLTKNRIALPEPEEELKYTPFFKSILEAQTNLLKYYYSAHETFINQNDQSNLFKDVPENYDSSSKKKWKRGKDFEFSNEVLEDEDPKNKIFKYYDLCEDSQQDHILTIETFPFFNSKLVRNMNILIENVHLFFDFPIETEIKIEKIVMNTNEYFFKIIIKKNKTKDLFVEFCKIAWGEEFLHFRVDKIMHESSIIFNSRPSISKLNQDDPQKQCQQNIQVSNKGRYTISNEKSIFDTAAFQFVLNDLVVESNKLEIDLSLCANPITAFFGSFVHFIARKSIFTLEVAMNDNFVCNLIIRPLSPMATLNENGRYFKLLKIELIFNKNTKALIKKENQFNLSLKGFKNAATPLNDVSILILPNKLPILKIRNIYINKFEPISTPEKCFKAENFTINHCISKPEHNELICITSLFRNYDLGMLRRKYNLFIEPFFYYIEGNRFIFHQEFDQQISLMYQPSDDPKMMGSFLGSVSCKTKLFDHKSKIACPKNIYYYFFDKHLKLKINDLFQLNLELDENILEDNIFPNLNENNKEEKLMKINQTKISYDLQFKWLNKGICFSIDSKNHNLQELLNSKNLKNCVTLSNTLEIQDLSFSKKIMNISVTPQTTPFFINFTSVENEIFIYLKKEAKVELLMKLSEDNIVSHTKAINLTSGSINGTESKYVVVTPGEDTIGNILRGGTNKSTGFYDLNQLINYICSFNLSDYHVTKKRIQSSDISLSFDFEIKDTTREMIEIISLLSIPGTIIPEEYIPLLQLFNDVSIIIYSDIAKFTFSFDFNYESLKIKQEGRINFKSEELKIQFLINGEVRWLRDIKTNFIFDKLVSLYSTENVKVQNVISEAKELTHVKFLEILRMPNTDTKFKFQIFPELLNKNISEGLGNLLRNLPLEKYPDSIILNFKLDESPDLIIKVKEQELVKLGKITCEIKNKYPIIYNDNKDLIICTETLDKIYNSDKIEIEYFLSNNIIQSLNKQTFKLPIDVSFNICSNIPKDMILTQNILNDAFLTFSKSTTKLIFEKLPENKTNSEAVDGNGKDKNEISDKLLKIWLTTNNHGAFIMKIGQTINFIGDPLSIFVLSNELPSMHIRLAGLQKDVMLEEDNIYNNTFVFVLFKYKKLAKKTTANELEKNCLKLVTLFKDEVLEIFSLDIDTSLTSSIKRISNVYLSSVGKVAIKSFFSLKKKIFKKIDKEGKFGYKIENSEDRKWSGSERFNKLQPDYENERNHVISAL